MRCAGGRGLKLCETNFRFCGLTGVISGTHREIAHGSRDVGEDGQGAAARERVETKRIEACPLRGASDRGQGDVRSLAGRVRTGAQYPLRQTMSRLARFAQSTC